MTRLLPLRLTVALVIAASGVGACGSANNHPVATHGAVAAATPGLAPQHHPRTATPVAAVRERKQAKHVAGLARQFNTAAPGDKVVHAECAQVGAGRWHCATRSAEGRIGTCEFKLNKQGGPPEQGVCMSSPPPDLPKLHHHHRAAHA